MASHYNNEKTQEEKEKESANVNVLGVDSTAVPDYSDEKKEDGFEPTRTVSKLLLFQKQNLTKAR